MKVKKLVKFEAKWKKNRPHISVIEPYAILDYTYKNKPKSLRTSRIQNKFDWSPGKANYRLIFLEKERLIKVHRPKRRIVVNYKGKRISYDQREELMKTCKDRLRNLYVNSPQMLTIAPLSYLMNANSPKEFFVTYMIYFQDRPNEPLREINVTHTANKIKITAKGEQLIELALSNDELQFAIEEFYEACANNSISHGSDEESGISEA